MARMWMCPDCETLAPMAQARCGGCGHPQTSDAGNVSIRDMAALTADAEIYKSARPRGRKR